MDYIESWEKLIPVRLEIFELRTQLRELQAKIAPQIVLAINPRGCWVRATPFICWVFLGTC